MSDREISKNAGKYTDVKKMDKRIRISHRLSDFFLGNPSVKRAYGIYGRKWLRKVQHCGMHTDNAPSKTCGFVFALEAQHGGSAALPKIWITEQTDIVDASTEALREISASYPNGIDKGGWKALELAERMLGEGFNADGDCPSGIRKRYFQAAEILLLHAVYRRNTEAYLKLGDLYNTDLCKGDYWRSESERLAQHARSIDKVELLRRAWMLYSLAARKGSFKAYMKLGDVLMNGVMRKDDLTRAYKYFCKSAGMAVTEMLRSEEFTDSSKESYGSDVIEDVFRHVEVSLLEGMGAAMLRVALCVEQGIGCSRNIRKANELFTLSKKLLGIAFESGCWHTKMEMIKASNGIRRTRFEINMETEELEMRA